MPGPAPKPIATRQRRNKVATGAVLPAALVPTSRTTLPGRADSETWRPEAVDLWRLAWASPMAGEYLDSDVPGLLVIAELTHEFWTMASLNAEKASKIAAELRLQRREYGLAPLARRSLQWEVAKVKEATTRAEAPAAPRQIKDPRSVLHSVG